MHSSNEPDNPTHFTDAQTTNGENISCGLVVRVLFKSCLKGLAMLWVTAFVVKLFNALHCEALAYSAGWGLLAATICTPVLTFRDGIKEYLKGPCPYCGYDVEVSRNAPGEDCPACKQRILIRKQRFICLK